jgi:hypothetical protein
MFCVIRKKLRKNENCFLWGIKNQTIVEEAKWTLFVISVSQVQPMLAQSFSSSSNEFIIYFLKSFCINIRRFENFALLTSSRSGPRWFQHLPSWATAVRISPWGTQCHRRQHGVAQQQSWATAPACGIPLWATAVSFY